MIAIKKITLFLFILIITPLICGLFGIIHDQITYTISPEYFTKFKFDQFGIVTPSPRAGVMIVGILATWWMGIPMGLTYASVIMFFPAASSFYRIFFRTILLTLLVTILLGVIGYISGIMHLQADSGWFIPDDLTDREHFYYVGCIHNFSYLGGTIGMMIGILYLIILYNMQKRNRHAGKTKASPHFRSEKPIAGK